jgi:hypothetical protein
MVFKLHCNSFAIRTQLLAKNCLSDKKITIENIVDASIIGGFYIKNMTSSTTHLLLTDYKKKESLVISFITIKVYISKWQKLNQLKFQQYTTIIRF